MDFSPRNPEFTLEDQIHYLESKTVGVRSPLVSTNNKHSYLKELFMQESILKTLKQTQELLKEIEYSSGEAEYDYNYDEDLEYSGTKYVCPVCGYEEGCGHSPDCKLDLLLNQK